MNNIYEINNMCKEVLTILSYCDNTIIDKIPDKIFNKLKKYADNSNNDFKINFKKSLKNQNMSNSSKDLLAVLYYNYIANDFDKKEILNYWKENENKNKHEYTINKICDNNISSNSLIETD